MNSIHQYVHTRGMTLVEVIFAIAVLLLVFGGVMVSFQFMVSLIGSSKAQAGGLSLANEKMEYIRSLPYDDVGTIGGIPDGPILQLSTSTLNGFVYTERVLIEYVDSPADGEGLSDINGILADYKLVKIEYSWTDKVGAKNISLISNIIPKGIETTAGGGTLVVNAFDATVQPVSGAAVHVYNNTGSTTIDTIRYSNSSGVAMFAGAPALSNYEITVTSDGYSTDQTYSASIENPNPITPHVAVLESEVSTMNFQIDELSDLNVVTVGVPTTGTFEDLFDDTGDIATSTDVTVSAGEVTLAGAPSSYSATGSLFSVPINPGPLDSWDTLAYQGVFPIDTSLVVRVYDATSSTTLSLIPDTDLPGNSTGFTPGSTDLTSLDTNIYQKLSLGVTLGTTDTTTTSKLFSWNVTYTVSQPVITNVPFALTGNKKIGLTASSTPVFKYSQSFSTDGTGNIAIPNLEWDVYDVVVTNTSYDVAEACSDIPYSLEPGVSQTLTLTLAPSTARSLRVNVVDINGVEIPNATVDLSRAGFSDSAVTTTCGQTFFNTGLSSAIDYVLTVSAFGYDTQMLTDVAIEGTTVSVVVLTSV